MLKISRGDKTFNRLETPSLAAASILERNDLQEYIFNSAREFFAELGEEFFILGKEVLPSEIVQDRIDLLGVDKDGNAVIIELKRGNDKLQLLQAVAYAGMVAQWTTSELEKRAATQIEELEEWLDVERNELNRQQRILLIAEAFDYEVLAAAEWLYERFKVEIACARLSLAVDPLTGAEYLSCVQIFPTPELSDQALIRRRPSSLSSETVESWDEWLAKIRNSDVADFTRKQLAAGCENRTKGHSLFFRVNGKRRLSIEIRTPHGTVWQSGRFQDDVQYWKARLANQAVEPLNRGQSLRFFLKTADDCSRFLRAIDEIAARPWDMPTTANVEGELLLQAS